MKKLFEDYGDAILLTLCMVFIILIIGPLSNQISGYMRNSINEAGNQIDDTVDKISYRVVYVSSSGKELGTSKVSYKLNSTHTIEAPTKVGYLTPNSQEVEFTKENKTITFTYDLIDYTITYDLDGGKNNPDNPETYNIESEEIELLDPTKDDADFKGWFSESTFENQIVKISPRNMENITLYARFKNTNDA